MMTNYYPRLKSMMKLCVLAVSSTLLVFNSTSSIAQTTVSPTAAIPGSTVTITGTGFNTTLGSNTVFFGGVKVSNIVSGSATTLAVTVPVGASNNYVSVENNSTLAWSATTTQFNPQFNNCYVPGSNALKPNVDYVTGAEPYLAAFADLDGDGKLDMVVACHSTSKIYIRRNIGSPGIINTATYTDTLPFTAAGGPSNIKFADLDRDGKLDIIVSCNRSSLISIFRNTSVSGTISFAGVRNLQVNTSSAFGGYPFECAIADFDGDGKPDIAAVVRQVVNSSPFPATGFDSVKIIRNLISGTVAGNFLPAHFAAPVSFGLPNFSAPSSITAADFDGDGKMDIATANAGFGGTPGVSVLRNISTSGSPNFAAHFELGVLTSSYSQQVIAADIDGDSKPEIVVSSTDYYNFGGVGAVSVFRNTASSGSLSTASFSSRADYTVPSYFEPIGITAADMDADGKTDIVATYLEGQVVTFQNSSSIGSVSLASNTSLSYNIGPGHNSIGIAVADIDGDKKGDVAVANSTANTISIFRNYGTPNIGPVTGHASLCVGTADTFKNSVSGGTWSVTNTARATIDAVTGIVTPLASGNDTAVYTMICNYDTAVQKMAFTVSVMPVVAVITGTATSLCRGTSISLNDVTTGGTWTTSNAAVATLSVSGTTATVNGIGTGTATITYAVTNGCGTVQQTYGPITVNVAPGPITGTATVCANNNITLVDTPTGGTWTSVSPSIATVLSPGVIRGLSAGNATISYTIGSCAATRVVTVSAGPSISPITGSASSVCLGANLSLSDATTPGTWRSANTAVASVNSSGVVHGATVGNTTISYIVSNSCGTDSVGYAVTVNPVPGNITGSTFRVCAGSDIILNNTVSTGTWASTTLSVATVAGAGGTATVHGVGSGTSVISYTLPGGCYDTALVTVDALPAAIGGTTSVCAGSTVTLNDASTPGSWSATGGFVTVNSSTGAVTGVNAGTTNITFTQTSTGCSVSTPFTVNALPDPITGSFVACVGASNTLVSGPSGGTWTINPTSGVANIDPSSGMVTGVASGSATVSYTLPVTGCAVGANITVAPSPGVISGPSSVCLGAFITLTDTPSGGTWTSSNAVAAPVNAVGIVSGASLGTTVISYTLSSSGCRATHTVTVTPPPAAITGASAICPFTSITLSDATTLGVWSSNNLGVAVVNSSTGQVTGVSGGTALISYTLLATGCYTFVPVTVHNAPSVTGSPIVCVGHQGHLFVDSVVGIWSSTDTNIVKVDTATGLLTGRTPGTVIVTYTTPTYGCFDSMAVTSYDTVVPVVTISVSPTLTLTGHIASVCQNTPVTYTANVTNGGPAPSYQWRVNGTPVGTGISYSYTPGNNDSISCQVSSNAICATPSVTADYIKMNVITNRTPILNLAPSVGGDTTCLGNPVTLNPNPVWAGTSPTFNWKVNGVNVGPGSTFTYVPANGDVITVVVHSNYICPLVDTATDTLHLTVSPYVTPTITLIGSDTTCELYPTVYIAAQTGGGFTPIYQFFINGAPAPASAVSGNMLSYMATNGDLVNVVMTSSFPCTTTPTVTSTTHSVTVIPTPIPSITVAVTPGYILAPGMTATFIATPVNPGPSATYQWKKNGVVIPLATSLTYSTASFASGDSFTCVMTTNDLCRHISVYGSAEVYIGDNVGINQVNSPNAHVAIMPNPTRGRFTILGNTGITANEEITAEVTNMLGQVVYRTHCSTVNGAIESEVLLGEELANGMYILNLRSEHLAKAIHFELAK